MNESGCFFKMLPAKGLAQKEKKAKGVNNVSAEDNCCIFRNSTWRENW